jgi:hypothetical protein
MALTISAAVFHTAVRNYRDAERPRHLGAAINGVNAACRPGDDPRVAKRTGPDPDFDRIRASLN